MLTHYAYPVMKRAYRLAIFLSDKAGSFETYVYNWLTLFEDSAELIQA